MSNAQIERLKGIKDKIEVGVTLPVIERQEKATLTIKKDPLIIIQKNTKKDIVAIKLKAVYPTYYSNVPQNRFLIRMGADTLKVPALLNAERKYPKEWKWRVICRFANNQEKTLNTFLCNDKKYPITYTQDLGIFLQDGSRGWLVGYNFSLGMAVYLNRVDFNNVMADNIQWNHKELVQLTRQGRDGPSGPVERILSNNSAIKEMTCPYDLLWNYKNKNFTLEVEQNSWLTFSLNSSKISIKNNMSDWIPIVVKN